MTLTMSTPARICTPSRARPGMQASAGLLTHHRPGLLPAQQDDIGIGMLLGDLGGRLDAGQAPAGHDDGAVAEVIQLVGQRVGVVRAVQRVGELVDAGNGVGVGNTAQRIDQGVVAQHVFVVDTDGLCVGVDGRDPALDEAHAGTREPVRNLQVGQLLTGGRSGATAGAR